METLPATILIQEILSKLDIQTLSILSSTNKTLKSTVESDIVPSITSLELPSSLILDSNTLYYILIRFNNLDSLTLNSQRLNDSSITRFLTQQLHHLCLSSCSLLSYQFLTSIADNCPNLRVLKLEMADQGSPRVFKYNVRYMLRMCNFLECLCIKIRGENVDSNAFRSIGLFLSKNIKILNIKPVLHEDAIFLAKEIRSNCLTAKEDIGTPVSRTSYSSSLQCLSLVLDVISDRLLGILTSSLPLLVELDLEDRPFEEPFPHLDLTNDGLQSLGSCHNLTSLSLIRSRKYYQGSFTRITDIGMFLLSESCKGLQSVTLCGFSKVVDAGFAALLQSCQKLQKFEIRNACFLSDLAFHNLTGTACSLVEVRLLSCNLITSETAKILSSCGSLEVLDLCGCKSIADSGLISILQLQRLTSLNLCGADITDTGLSELGKGSLRITRLSLRACKRVTDTGIFNLLCGGGTIAQTLAALDLGYMPRLSDRGIFHIVSAGREITELCIRSCFFVTDSSMQALATKRSYADRNKPIQRLDLCNCCGLTAASLEFLRKPFFNGLHWIGIGQTRLVCKRPRPTTEICDERPWLTICSGSCEMGCHDGWQFH